MDGNHKWQVCALYRYVNWYMTMVINCIYSLDTTALDYASCRGHISSYITPLHHEHITWSSHGNHGILSYYDHLPTCFKTSQAYVKRPSSSPSLKTLAHSFSTGPSMVFPHGCFFFSSINPLYPGGVFIISLSSKGLIPKALCLVASAARSAWPTAATGAAATGAAGGCTTWRFLFFGWSMVLLGNKVGGNEVSL